MAQDRHARQGEEPQRFMGVPLRGIGPRARRDYEPQRVMGFPIDSFGPSAADRERLLALAHPVRMYKRWARRRRLGPYAVDDDQD
jgi:hypothetical protein